MDIEPFIGSGRVTCNSLEIDTSKRLVDEILSLDEDLLQIEYPSGYAVDLGWYPSANLDGSFLLQVVYGDEWDCPVCRISFRRMRHITGLLRLCAQYVESLSEPSDEGTLDPPWPDAGHSVSDVQPLIGNGVVTYGSSVADPSKRSVDEVSVRGENLLRIEYPNSYMVDLGWYPMEGPGGRFLLFIVQGGDWDCPECHVAFSNIRYLPELLLLCSQFVESLLLDTSDGMVHSA